MTFGGGKTRARRITSDFPSDRRHVVVQLSASDQSINPHARSDGVMMRRPMDMIDQNGQVTLRRCRDAPS